MIVELYGLPGSGKSRLGKILANDYVLINLSSRQETIIFLLKFAFRHLVSFVWWHLMWLRYFRFGLNRYRYHLMTRGMAMFAKAESIKTPNTVVIIDEGLIQRILSLAESSLTAKQIEFWLRVSAKPDLVIALPGGDFYRFEQAEDRDLSPRRQQGQKYYEQWKQVLMVNHRLIQNAFSKIKCLKTNIPDEQVKELAYLFN